MVYHTQDRNQSGHAQVIQADAVKDIEWLNRWLNCFLDDEALEVFEAQLLDAKKIEKTISLATRFEIHKNTVFGCIMSVTSGM